MATSGYPPQPHQTGAADDFSWMHAFGFGFFRSQAAAHGGAAAHPNPSIRAGYTLHHTARGQPYYVKEATGEVAGSSSEDEEAMNEWVREKKSILIRGKELEKEYGLGIWLYFDFARFIMLMNFFLFAFALINWIPFILSSDAKNVSGLELFFVANYSADLRPIWIVTSVFVIITSFLFGPLYVKRITKIFIRKKTEDREDFFEGTEHDIIKENQHIGFNNRFWRIVFGYVLFSLLLVIQGVVTWIVFNSLGQEGNAGSIVTSIMVAILNIAWKRVCVFLTKFEKHKTWTLYRKHNTVKFILFRLLNIFVLYLIKLGLNTSESEQNCILEIMARQYFWLLIFDMFFLNTLEILVPWLRMKFCPKETHGSDESMRPEFDTAEEYLELIYRQFIIYSGSIVCPLISFMGIVAFAIEFALDRMRLIRLCQKPPRTRASMRKFLAFFLMLTALFSFLSYPIGSLFVLTAAYSDSQTSECRVYN